MVPSAKDQMWKKARNEFGEVMAEEGEKSGPAPRSKPMIR
jgi:hypothetical protein